jgi:hypothetical protein
MAKLIRYDACNLSRLFEEVYGVDFNIPYMIMQDDNMIEESVSSEKLDDAIVAELQAKGEEMDNVRDIFEDLLNDLCFRGKLKAGDYLIKFDD